jgi:hypothetical protein
MEKDIDKIPKNPETDIVIRIDDYGGRKGLTIREFVRSERYTGFTKAGTRIPADKFKIFKAAINSIDESDLEETEQTQTKLKDNPKPKDTKKSPGKKEVSSEEIEEQAI